MTAKFRREMIDSKTEEKIAQISLGDVGDKFHLMFAPEQDL
jgi:hypothetical protein